MNSTLLVSFLSFLADLVIKAGTCTISIFVGVRHEVYDDSRSSITTTSTSSPLGDARSLEQEGGAMAAGGAIISGPRVICGALEILSLLRTLGEGYRLLCVYSCQVLLSN